jgi:hypothetical protein
VADDAEAMYREIYGTPHAPARPTDQTKRARKKSGGGRKRKPTKAGVKLTRVPSQSAE